MCASARNVRGDAHTSGATSTRNEARLSGAADAPDETCTSGAMLRPATHVARWGLGHGPVVG